MNNWSENQLRELLAELELRGGDSTTVEVKTAQGGIPDSLPQTLCAFANMPSGGLIILGVNEKEGFIVTGIENPSEMEAALASQARHAITPPVTVHTDSVAIDGTHVVIAEVTGLPIIDKPAIYRGEAYLRMADGDYRMSASELRMMDVAKLHAEEAVSYDTTIVEGTSLADLDSNVVQDFLVQARKKNRRLSRLTQDEDVLRALAVTTATGELTLAGLYALGFYPQGHFPSLAVTVAQRLPNGSKHGRVLGLETFEGPVPVLLNSVMGWVRQRLAAVRRYREDGSMVEVPELPLPAIREAVANALVHRDLGPNTLGAGKSIDVRLLPDKMVISSPGGLRDLTVEQIKSRDLARQEINQRLYRLCRYLKADDGSFVIEGEGGGVQLMLDAAREQGLPEPDLIDSGVQFTVKMWRPDTRGEARIWEPLRKEESGTGPERRVDAPVTLERLGVNAPRVAEALRTAAQPLSIGEIETATNLTRAQVRYALKSLVKARFVRMDGTRGSQATTYEWLANRGAAGA